MHDTAINQVMNRAMNRMNSILSQRTSIPSPPIPRTRSHPTTPQCSTTPPSPSPSPLPSTFRRLIARRTGQSFTAVAEIEQTPMLQPGEGQVLIKVAYAGVNGGCETFRCQGAFAFARNKTLPSYPLGAEGTGVIVQLGPGVGTQQQPLHVGQHVTFIGGGFAEYVVANAALCWPVTVATPEAAALTISGTVACAALKYVAHAKEGDTVLVTAAGGATGSFAVQVAALAGCRVIAVCGSEAKEAKLRQQLLSTLSMNNNNNNMHRVINYRKEDVEEVLKQLGPVDVAYEGVGGGLQAIAWNALRPRGGRLLSVGYISEYPHVGEEEQRRQHELKGRTLALGSGIGPPLPPSSDLFWGGQTEVEEGGGGRTAWGKVWPERREDTLAAKREVFALHDAGELSAWVDAQRVFDRGVESVVEAVEWMLTGQAVGKVVVKF